MLSFLRYGADGSVVACVFNFAGSEHTRVPARPPTRAPGASCSTPTRRPTNGSGIGNFGAVEATDEPWHGRPASALLVLPPMSALYLEPA